MKRNWQNGRRQDGLGFECCGPLRRTTIIDYIERGLRRARQAPLIVVGDWIRDEDSRAVRFSVQTHDGLIERVSFNASFCVSLIAYCERLAESVTGKTVQTASRIRPAQLAAMLPSVPPYKRHLADLATEALSSAIESGGLK